MKKFKILCDNIQKRMSENIMVSDFVFDDFLTAISELCVSRTNPDTSKDLQNLFIKLSDIYAYDLYETESECRMFRLGALYGSLVTCARTFENSPVESVKRKRQDIEIVQNDIELFTCISDYPGISHKDLSEKLEITKIELTKKLAHLKYCQLISTSIQGRSKYYYPTKKLDSILSRKWF